MKDPPIMLCAFCREDKPYGMCINFGMFVCNDCHEKNGRPYMNDYANGKVKP